jgi:excisionase family DNA binding protein
MVDNPNELMTVAEVARQLGLSRHTVYRWIASGRLPATRFSRKVIRVRRSDLDPSAKRHVIGVGEPRITYETRPAISEAVHELALQRFMRSRTKKREVTDRPRSPDEPRPGSREALLRVVGIMSHEDAEWLRRVINEAKRSTPPSPPVEL